jgi:transcriptional regulator with XRE-family HTH domain
VAAELRHLRRNAGMTCADTAEAMGVSVTKISRMETGERGLYVDEVAALLGLYRVPAARRQELLELVRNGADPNWWQIKPSELPSECRDLMQLEKDAATIANFEPLIVPGLLQSSEYADALLRGMYELPEPQLRAMVATRMARQTLLSGCKAPSLHAIVDEMALHRPIGEPGVMHRQLQHLLTCCQRSNVTLQVVPVAVGSTTALEGPIVILDLMDGRSIAHLETRRAAGFLSEEAHLTPIRLGWQRLRAVALSSDKSARLIAAIARNLTRGALDDQR